MVENLPSSDNDPARASVRVLESAVALARAEVHLAVSEARGYAGRAVIALILAWASVTLTQVAIVMVSLAPALLALRPWPVVLLMVVPSVALAVATGFGAIVKFRSLVPRHDEPKKTEELVSKEVRA